MGDYVTTLAFNAAVPNLFFCCTPKLKLYLCAYPISKTYHKHFFSNLVTLN